MEPGRALDMVRRCLKMLCSVFEIGKNWYVCFLIMLFFWFSFFSGSILDSQLNRSLWTGGSMIPGTPPYVLFELEWSALQDRTWKINWQGDSDHVHFMHLVAETRETHLNPWSFLLSSGVCLTLFNRLQLSFQQLDVLPYDMGLLTGPDSLIWEYPDACCRWNLHFCSWSFHCSWHLVFKLYINLTLTGT